MAKPNKTEETKLAVVAEDALVVGGKPLGYVPEDEDAFAGMSVTTMVSLDDGRAIRGIFEGPGPAVQMTDPQTGEMRDVGTWLLRVAKNVCFQFATSSQLDSKLGAYPIGEVVSIKKLAESRRSRAGRVVSQYLVSDPPRKA